MPKEKKAAAPKRKKQTGSGKKTPATKPVAKKTPAPADVQTNTDKEPPGLLKRSLKRVVSVVSPGSSSDSGAASEEKKPARTNEGPGFLSRSFKNVAGIVIPGSLLTAGFATFTEIGYRWSNLSLTQQFISTASTLSGHLVVWSIAAGFGAVGFAIGRKFDDKDSKIKPRAWATAAGLALIAAAFAMPLNEKVSDAVEDSLTSIFETSATVVSSGEPESAKISPMAAPAFVIVPPGPG